MAIRRRVFIVEQRVPEELVVDGLDAHCRHYLGEIGGLPIATARVLPKGDTVKIQRVAVLQTHRGASHGAQMMRHLLDDLKPQFKSAVLGAQMHAIPFYERLGFTAFGPIYQDAGIDHRDMRIAL